MPTVEKLTKTRVESLQRGEILWESRTRGFGVRKQASAAVFIFKARVDGKQRFVTIGEHGNPWSVEQARNRAEILRGQIGQGHGEVATQPRQRGGMTVAELAKEFLARRAKPDLKASTATYYELLISKHVLPNFGGMKARALTRATVENWRVGMSDAKPTANRVLALLSAMYSWASDEGHVPKGTNPARDVKHYKEQARERYLTSDELARLGDAIREAETIGVPWQVKEGTKAKATAKHLPKEANQRTKIAPAAAAALRLLILTGARLREILHLEWQHVDLERGILFLPDSKTGRKALVLNAAAVQLLTDLPRHGRYVIAGASVGSKDEQPRSDLKRPWALVAGRAKLENVRLHDLRHTFASVAAASNIGLPVIGKLLGHSQTSTTERYAHLAVDPVRAATDLVGQKLAAAIGER